MQIVVTCVIAALASVLTTTVCNTVQMERMKKRIEELAQEVNADTEECCRIINEMAARVISRT